MIDDTKRPDIDENGRTPAFYAIQKDPSGSLLLDCLSEGCDPDVVDTRGDTALHWATWNRRSLCVHILLKENANPNIQNHKGHTPLHHVINRTGGDQRELSVLLSDFLAHGAQATLPDMEGKTVYHHVAQRSGSFGFEATSMLASTLTDAEGPDGWFMEDKTGCTPLNLAQTNQDARLSAFIAALQGVLLDRGTKHAQGSIKTPRRI